MQIKMRESRKGEDGTVLLKGTTYAVSSTFGAGLVAMGVAYDVSGITPIVGAQSDVAYNPGLRSLVRDGVTPLPFMQADMSGRPLDPSGRPFGALPYADARGVLIFFPLQENTSNKVYDISGQLIGSVNGGSSGQRWGQAGPGISLNGSNNRIPVTDGLQGGFTASAKFACDLSTLAARGDQITVFGVVSHPATLPADCWLLSWGMNADAAGKGGWAVGLKGTSGKLQFATRAKGGSSTVTTTMGVTGARGQNADNTRTAWALEISAAGISGLLELRAYMLTLGTDGGNAQSNVGLDTPALVPNGTASVGADTTSPLMLGAWCDTSTSTYVGYVGPNMAMLSTGLKRDAYDAGLGMRICRDLRNNIYALPASAR
jgi:hypothetical protein